MNNARGRAVELSVIFESDAGGYASALLKIWAKCCDYFGMSEICMREAFNRNSNFDLYYFLGRSLGLKTPTRLTNMNLWSSL